MNQNNFFQDMNNKIVDSHCHLSFKDFDEDRDLIIENARLNNVEFLLNISVNLEEFDDIHKITESYEKIWCTTGIHPNNVPKKLPEKKIEELKNVISSNIKKTKVIGIGETGLDFYYNHSKKDKQENLFIEHIHAAQESGLPIIVHTRSAELETYKILKSELKNKNFKILIHCFTGSKDFAHKLLDLGSYISASGIVTFKKSSELAEIFKFLPNDRILVETDSPYLSPDPLRGKPNEPSHIIHTVKFLSKLKNLNERKFSEITSNNFFNLFGKLN